MRRIMMAVALAACFGAASARAENLEIYRLSTGGVDAWIWGDAKIAEKLGKYVISENNKKGDTGGVYTVDKIPYFENGVIELLVNQVLAGNYTLQVLGFKGDDNLSTLEPISASTETGRQSFTLKGRDMALGVNTVTFKIWVGGVEGAATKIEDLVYSVPLEEGQVLLDEHFADKKAWQEENVLLDAVPGGMRMTVKPGNTFGNIFSTGPLDRSRADAVFFEVAEVKNCDLTVQLVTFDPDGMYFSSIDIIKKVTNGAHAGRLAQIAWPKEAETFCLKIWIGGGTGASAVLKRVLVTGSAM